MVTKKQILEAIKESSRRAERVEPQVIAQWAAGCERWAAAIRKAIEEALDARFAERQITKKCEHCGGAGQTTETIPPKIVELVDALRNKKQKGT